VAGQVNAKQPGLTGDADTFAPVTGQGNRGKSVGAAVAQA
jgi:hypothetical protein